MKKRWIVSVAAVVALLALTAGVAYAAGSGRGSSAAPATSGIAVACQAMHDSGGMQAMHDHMPAWLHERCAAMQEQMDQMMADSNMMGGSAAASRSMTGHHPPAEG